MPPETRRAAKRRKVREGVLIPPLDLPSEVMKMIFEFLDVCSLLQLGACNTALQQQVFDGPHSDAIWKVIDFGNHRAPRDEVASGRAPTNVPLGAAAKLTDRQLRSFLRKVHADERCQVLRLTGCTRLRGQGLEPLRGSCTLREIDLCFRFSHGPEEIDTNYVLPLLASMPPVNRNLTLAQRQTLGNSLGLSRIKLRLQYPEETYYYGRFELRTGLWLRRFAEALLERGRAARTLCGYCHQVITDKHKPEEWWAMKDSYCERCFKYTCQQGDCPFITECHKCQIQCCQCFGEAVTSKTQCPTHSMIYTCDLCKNQVCEDCFDGSQCAGCDDCCYCSACAFQAGKVCLRCYNDYDWGQMDQLHPFYCLACVPSHQNQCHLEAGGGGQEESSGSMWGSILEYT